MAIILNKVPLGGVVSKSNYLDPVVDILKALANQVVGRFASLPGTDFTSTTNADLAGASVPFTKLLDADKSTVEITASAQAYNAAGAINYVFTLAARLAGVDYDIASYPFNVAQDNRVFIGTVRISGLAVGAYTVQLRGRNITTGSTTRVSAGALVVVNVKEIPIIG